MKKRLIHILIFAFVTIGVIVISFQYIDGKNKSSDDCLICHEDHELHMEEHGKKISLFVDPKLYRKSVHGFSECNDCHKNYSPDVVPHTNEIKPVNCFSCHEEKKVALKDVHAKVDCYSCHNKTEMKIPRGSTQEIQESCLNCHKSRSVTQFINSTHDKNNVKCSDCHKSGHTVTKVQRNEVLNVCGKCHSSEKMNLSSSVHHSTLKAEGKNSPVCTDCHGSHKVFSSKYTIQSEGCLKCHLNEKMFPGTETGSAKFVAQYRTSVHATLKSHGREAAGCIDCHGDHSIYPDSDPKSATNRARLIETCAKCHSNVTDKFKNSKHGKELLAGNENAPSCVDCHGEHDIKSTLFSEEFTKLNLVDKCLDCHVDGKIPHRNFEGENELITGYRNSVHYQALLDGNLEAPTCYNCHGAHEMENADDPTSKINQKNIERTCGQSNCHHSQLSDFMGSVHEIAIVKGNKDSPTCNTCHGNHVIVSKDIDGQLQKSRDVIKLCESCHASSEIVERNDLPLRVTETFNQSFHGLAIRGGSIRAANCESCHGYHNIRPSSDPLSSIHRDNLPQTCGHCHPGAKDVLLIGKIHLTDLVQDSPWLYAVRAIYMVLIVGIIGFMIVHNFLDFKRKKAILKNNKFVKAKNKTDSGQ